ncbi:hypothetical protein [Methylobacterium sp. J-077]|uniref:hypothetical protein n=1 Tax=Methylobacterium sp. J-077 TaxID=2836656 RepID=UPI001FB9A51F|nr:hypothetical protein [Methylobacterium sp. J-077]MCJ2127186.1 hypothetical protein [Methylobacterium sp. J-077]
MVTRSGFKSAYELYAHVKVAMEKGMREGRVATIVSGQRPSDLTTEKAAVFDAASSQNAGGVLPRPVYDRVVAAFVAPGVSELIHRVGLYAMVCITLNGFDVPVPEQQVEPAP